MNGMHKSIVPLLTITGILFTGCTQYAYYQSPLLTHTNGYKAMPMQDDKKEPALYGGLSIASGGANENWHDELIVFSGEVHQAHNFGIFQAFYGICGTMGQYTVNTYTPQNNTVSPYYNKNLNDSLINALSGKKDFGAWGFSGGIAIVKSFPKGGEWRIIGLEYNWQQEWGDYLSFRKKLPVTAANLIDYSNRFSTISITSDIIGKLKNNISIGYKVAMGITPRLFTYYNETGEASHVLPANLSQTLHLTNKRVTGYLQGNIGYRAASFHLGVNYRLR